MLLNSLLVSYGNCFEDESGNVHYDYPDVWTSFAKDALSGVFLWSAVALIVVLLAVALFLRLKKPEALKAYATVAIALAVGFSLTVIVTMSALEFLDMKESGAVFDLVLYPAIVLGATVVLGAAAIYVSSFCGERAKKRTKITSLSVMGAALVAMLVCLGVYLAKGSAEDNNGATISVSENIALYLCAAALVAVIAFFALFLGRKDKRPFDSKSIAYAAICIAMSFALSYLRLWKMPQGGSITAASLLPLMLYAYMFGTKKGVFTGLIYGVLQAVQDPWLIHPAQFLLDYPVAFAAIGLAGTFAEIKKLDKLPQVQFALGAIVATVLRFISHVLSGVFAFSEYSTLDNVWIYSMAYNSFVFVDILIVIAVGVLVFSSPTLVKTVRRFHNKDQEKQEIAE